MRLLFAALAGCATPRTSAPNAVSAPAEPGTPQACAYLSPELAAALAGDTARIPLDGQGRVQVVLELTSIDAEPVLPGAFVQDLRTGDKVQGWVPPSELCRFRESDVRRVRTPYVASPK